MVRNSIYNAVIASVLRIAYVDFKYHVLVCNSCYSVNCCEGHMYRRNADKKQRKDVNRKSLAAEDSISRKPSLKSLRTWTVLGCSKTSDRNFRRRSKLAADLFHWGCHMHIVNLSMQQLHIACVLSAVL